jgi:hypothetical protein
MGFVTFRTLLYFLFTIILSVQWLLSFLDAGHNISTTSTAVRVIFVTSYLTAVVLFACYSAGFVSYMTLRHNTLPFTSFRGFLQDGSYKLLAMKRSVEWDYFRVSKLEHRLTVDL